MSISETYMKRAFDLALLGAGDVSPNPLVGCVIVHDEQIIGEGYHRKYGGPHAEVNAINAVPDEKWKLLSEATVYVTLEPCSHHGKTPPCADLLVSHAVKKVVIANLDPNPLVSGNGIKKLEEAGIEVETGCLQELGEEVNRRFFTFMREKRPYIMLKWAETSDGFVAREDYSSKWISSALSRQMVHRWRAEEDAIMVGTGTAKHDDPSLTVRDWVGTDPLRLVLDKELTLSKELKLFSDGIKTVCFNTKETSVANAVEYMKIDWEKVIDEVLEYLYQHKIQSLIVEGGSYTLGRFIQSGNWDEARIFVGESTFGKGIESPSVKGQLVEQIRVEGDTLLIKKNR